MDTINYNTLDNWRITMNIIDITPEMKPADKGQLRQQVDDLSKVYDLTEALMGSLSLIRMNLAGILLPGLPGHSVIGVLRVRAMNDGIVFYETLRDLQGQIGMELTDLQITLDVMEGVHPGGSDDR
jgi:hypothetical protein